MKKAGLYIHIPFCDGKCPYCSFYSKRGSAQQLDRYTKAVINAIADYPHDFEAETIYFGGGTPSVMGAERLCRILAAAKERFGENQLETTVEVNPCTATEELLAALKSSGFDRISFGVQSMNDRLLKVLGRKHSADQAKNAILLAHKAGFKHISADLMLALPEQTVADIQSSIEQLAQLPIDHLSAYILKIEQGTAFYNRYPDPDEDFAADCYQAMQQKCSELGFEQYEISNFSKGKAARGLHNLNYWRCKEYLGIGPSAHSFMNGRRFYFEGDLDAFLNADDPWSLTVDDGEGGNDEEKLMLGLRLADGIDLSGFDSEFTQSVLKSAAPLLKAGLLTLEDHSLKITDGGFIVSNSIIASLI